MIEQGSPAGRLVVIGEVTRTHGLQGEVRVIPMTDHPERFDDLAWCVLWDAARDERETRRITAARRQAEAIIMKLEGCITADAAAGLVGRLVAVPESQAVPPPPGQFYLWQIAGAHVVTEDGQDVGRMTGIEHSPAHDLWVVAGPDREHLIPAVPEIVVDVDVAAGRVVIRPPAGLLEL